MDNRTTRTTTPTWIKLCLWAGLVCIGQFFVFALAGVIRGYSIRSWTPSYVMLGGVLLLTPFLFCAGWMSRYYKKMKQTDRISYLISFCIILFSVPGILQGRYQKQADELYKQQNYPAAIAMYKKEVGAWYLRLRYNYHEDPSLFGIARSYCQQENFEQGRQTYQRLSEMAHSLYQERSQEELAELDWELKNIAEFEKQLAKATDDNQKAQVLFDMALSYRCIECVKKAKEQYALVQTLDIPESRKALARNFAADDTW